MKIKVYHEYSNSSIGISFSLKLPKYLIIIPTLISEFEYNDNCVIPFGKISLHVNKIFKRK